ncbi:hypothetical protein HY251_20645 [bacterium]|nr:hypothetical protein [bacterium]
MADEAAEDQQPEIIPRQPSHPITTTLIIVTCIGVIFCIGFEWAELFGYYLLSPKVTASQKDMVNHDFKKTQKRELASIDHYALDFPGEGDPKNGRTIMEYNIRKDLGLTQEQEDKVFGAK